MPLGELLMIFALAGILVGSLVAIFQTNMKRMLAYSSVAQIGYMALGMSFANVNGLVATLVHMFNHAAMKGTLFLVLACVTYRIGASNLKAMRGLGRRMPFTMAAFVAAGFSLVGLPLTVGFVSKWYLLVAAIESGRWPVAVLVLVGSLLAFVYIWRVIEVAYFREPHADAPEVIREAPLALVVPTLVLAATTIYFGIDTDLTVGVARVAALTLLGGFQ